MSSTTAIIICIAEEQRIKPSYGLRHKAADDPILMAEDSPGWENAGCSSLVKAVEIMGYTNI
jgi:hypothetical protein